MRKKIVELIYDLRHQPLITWVTLIGTSLTVSLIMVLIVMQQITVLPMAPESNRPRLLHGWFLEIAATDGDSNSSAGLSYQAAESLYGNLEGVERMSIYSCFSSAVVIEGTTHYPISAELRPTDAEFFNIFDHTLVAGRYYSPQEAFDNLRLAVINESSARQIFGDTDPVGQTMYINFEEYKVVGVVKDHTRLATNASADVFVPLSPRDKSNDFGNYLGMAATVLLMEDGADPDDIRTQLMARYDQLNTELAPENLRAVYHGQPYDQYTVTNISFGSNTTPDGSKERNIYIIIYILLFLVPAINLSSILNSRLRRRVGEIGLRRAFGCTRRRLIVEILTENFIVTLIGGFFGIIIGYIFLLNIETIYCSMIMLSDSVHSLGTPPLSALLNWKIILMAFGVCLILNVLTALVPAWQATRRNIVEAINGKV